MKTYAIESKDTCQKLRYFIRSRKKSVFLLCGVMALFLITGCSSTWEPADTEAIYLVENYYLYSHGGKAIDAELVSRGEYDRACKCFPMKFRIITPEQKPYTKTFYFYRNESGRVEVSEYQNRLNR